MITAAIPATAVQITEGRPEAQLPLFHRHRRLLRIRDTVRETAVTMEIPTIAVIPATETLFMIR